MFEIFRKKRITKYTDRASEYLEQTFTPEAPPVVPKKESITKFKLDTDLGGSTPSSKDGVKYQKKKTLVECTLDTGRTHQIRVHLSSINHPLVGDEIYGKKAKVRCCLHSHTITLFHPILKEEIKVTCELSEDIKEWMRK